MMGNYMDNNRLHDFAEMLRILRFSRNLSQKELAQRAQLHPSHISRMEKGEHNPPRRESVLRIAEAMALEGSEWNAFFEAAGYQPSSRRRAVGFASPLRHDEIAIRVSIPQKLRMMDKDTRRAVTELVTVIAESELSEEESVLVSKQLRAMQKSLKVLLESMRKGGEQE